MVIHKSRGQGPKNMENNGTNLSRTFNKNLHLVPWIEEKPYFQMLIWYFSNHLDIYYYAGKLSKQHISVWLFSNLGDKILFSLKFHEARISEWNINYYLWLSLKEIGEQHIDIYIFVSIHLNF